MSTLFVGNCTKQDHIFRFHLPEKRNASVLEIKSGTQIQLYDLPTPAIDAIVQAHAPYGFSDASQIDRLDDYVGLCYSIDKPIPGKRLTYAVEHNMHVLEKRGEEIRAMAAVSAAKNTELVAAEANLNIHEMKVDITEVTQGGDKGFADSVTFIQQGADTKPPKPGRGRPSNAERAARAAAQGR